MEVTMQPHHRESLDRFLDTYSSNESVIAVLLVGSIAHGFARPDSDIDLCLVVTPDEFRRRRETRTMAFSVREYCDYDGGYIDCKVVDPEFLQKVADSGSDPARYAFKDARIVYGSTEGLEELLTRIATYPASDKETRRKRFASQVLAWKWYYSEGVKKENLYLTDLALARLVLFGCRLVLNENEVLYPFHKWLLRVLETCERAPDRFREQIEEMLSAHSREKVEQFCAATLDFVGFTEKSVDWPNWFMKDSEQNWVDHEAPIDDL